LIHELLRFAPRDVGDPTADRDVSQKVATRDVTSLRWERDR